MTPINAKYQVMPDLSEAEYNELKEDISERGVQVPIEFDDDGNVLDGHHRLRACEELGIADYPKVTRYGFSESEKRHHARKLNMARRQMTQQQRRELIKDQLRETPEKSDRQIAGSLSVDHKTVSTQRRELERGGEIPHLNTAAGADGKTYPRMAPKKTIAVFNPTEFEEKQIKENLPAIIEKLESGKALDVRQARIMAVDEKRHAEEMARQEEVERENRELREYLDKPSDSNVVDLKKEHIRRKLEDCDQAVVDAQNVSDFRKAVSFSALYRITDNVLDSVAKKDSDLPGTINNLTQTIEMLTVIKNKLITRGGKNDGKTKRD